MIAYSINAKIADVISSGVEERGSSRASLIALIVSSIS